MLGPALDRLRTSPFDLILLDVRVRGTSPDHVVREVGARAPGTPIVLLGVQDSCGPERPPAESDPGWNDDPEWLYRTVTQLLGM